MELNCNIVKDLMPSYVDHLCSQDTTALIKEHIAVCNDCSKILNAMMHPENDVTTDTSDILKAQEPFRKIKLRNRLFIFFSIFFTALIMLTGMFLVQEVEPIHHFFIFEERVVIQATPDEEWHPLTLETSSLIYDKVICKKRITNDAASSGNIVIKITDKEGNIVISQQTIEPGCSLNLAKLKRNKEYFIYYKAKNGTYWLTFN